jgi:two-component system, NtrC family, response regulator HydG
MPRRIRKRPARSPESQILRRKVAPETQNRLTDPSFDDLQSSFRFIPDKAEIWLNGQRMVLMNNASLGVMRREMVLALGYERARAVMSRIGYKLGAADAELALRLRKDSSLFEGFTVGPQLHALKGSVKVEPVVFEADAATGNFYSEYYWHNSAECQAHLAEMGVGPASGGWQQVGHASGYASAFFGRPIIFRELECIATGHDRCFLIGKPAENWADPEAELRWFRAETYMSRPTDTSNNVEGAREDLRVGLRSMVGASSGFNIVLHLVDKVAGTIAPVLFLGESGVGKEVFARELHKRSKRAERPMLAVNCAAIPETLVEAELFGVERGAFTGASRSRPGRFERAQGGTLFLDEIGTLSLSAQGKLLRVLQENEFERVGGLATLRADVRLIAATNADLRSNVANGTFRADLFHRLNTFPINIPPLRERRADIPLLVNHFLRLAASKHGRNVKGFEESALQYLRTYDWPGNIRELENTIERGVILADDGAAIGLHHLLMSADHINAGSGCSGLDPFKLFVLKQVRNRGEFQLGDELLDRGLSHDVLLGQMISAALGRSKGNISQAARAVGMSRSQITYWLKQHRTKQT